jgi:hypothetical protein
MSETRHRSEELERDPSNYQGERFSVSQHRPAATRLEARVRHIQPHDHRCRRAVGPGPGTLIMRLFAATYRRVGAALTWSGNTTQ